MALVIAGLFVASRFLPFGEWIHAFTDWIKAKGPLGVAMFAAGYILGTLLFFPGSLMTIAGGIAFGFWGIPLVLLSATAGASLAFLLARYVARGTIERRAKGNEKFQKMDEAIGKNGWKIVGLMRLSPVLPYNLSNYLFGITKVGFWPYMLASMIGMAPGTVMYVYLGHVGKASLGGAQKELTPEQWWLLAVGLVATAAVTVYVSVLTRKALKDKSH